MTKQDYLKEAQDLTTIREWHEFFITKKTFNYDNFIKNVLSPYTYTGLIEYNEDIVNSITNCLQWLAAELIGLAPDNEEFFKALAKEDYKSAYYHCDNINMVYMFVYVRFMYNIPNIIKNYYFDRILNNKKKEEPDTFYDQSIIEMLITI